MTGGMLSLSIHPRFTILVSVVSLVLLVNAGFVIAFQRLSQPILLSTEGQSDQVVLVTGVGLGQALIATSSNRVTLFRNGQPMHNAQFRYVVGAMAVAPDHSKFYIGTADGKVAILDSTFQQLTELNVTGRVVGLKALRSGGLFVAHGVGVRPDQYYVSYFEQTSPNASFTDTAAFTISWLDASDNIAYYTTVNSLLGAIGTDGRQLWLHPIPRPATRLLTIPQTNQIVTGDGLGTIALLDGQANVLWTESVSTYPIRSLEFDGRTSTLFAGDTHGNIFVLELSGTLLYSISAGTSAIEGLVTDSDKVTVVPHDGQWFALNPTAVRSSSAITYIKRTWFLINAAFLLASGLAFVLMDDAWRGWVRRVSASLSRSYTAYFFVLPSFALLMIFQFYPTTMAVYFSFTNFSLQDVLRFVGFANYFDILMNDFYFRVGFVNMAIIVATSVAKVITVPLLVAELIFRLRSRTLQYVLRTLFIFPAVVPDVVNTLIWKMIYSPQVGLLNQILRSIGLPSAQRAWLGDDQTALWAVVAAGFPFVSIFALLIYLGGLFSVNPEVYDSAEVDGVSWSTRFRHIDVPLLEPQFRLLLFFAFTGAIQGFANIWIFTRGGPGYATYTPALEMYVRLSEAAQFGYASAIGVILFVMAFIGTLFILRFHRQRQEIG